MKGNYGMLYTTRTVLAHTKCGVILISPQGGRKLGISAPASVKLTDRKGRPLGKRRPKGTK